MGINPFNGEFLPWPKVNHYEKIHGESDLATYKESMWRDQSYLCAHPNYDEALAGDLPLPSPLVDPSTGVAVRDASQWGALREKHLKNFQRILFGELPAVVPMKTEVLWEKEVFGGTCTRRVVRLTLENTGKTHQAVVLCHIPKREVPVPAIVAMNFKGNHACVEDPEVPMSPWEDMQANGRGCQQNRWDFRLLSDAGVAVFTCCYYDFYPDHIMGRKDSVYRLFHPEEELTPQARQYTAISAWAYGYSRMRELAATCPQVDPSRIWAHGHSRLGKTALWTAINDPLWAGAVSNCSGCAGAAPSRRRYGESLEILDHVFSWWTTEECTKYAPHPETLPFDQNVFLSLIAPRPVLVTSAKEDQWADPKGQFLCVKSAQEVYELLGKPGLPSQEYPALGQLLCSPWQGYYERYGIHDVTDEDWRNTLAFLFQKR